MSRCHIDTYTPEEFLGIFRGKGVDYRSHTPEEFLGIFRGKGVDYWSPIPDADKYYQKETYSLRRLRWNKKKRK